MSDEEIEEQRAFLEPLIGPTRARWYAEACVMESEYSKEELLWSCRFREMAREVALLETDIKERIALSKQFRELLINQMEYWHWKFDRTGFDGLEYALDWFGRIMSSLDK